MGVPPLVPSGDPGVEPFAAFVAGTAAARYEDYADRPGAAVQSRSAFEQMRRYLLDRCAALVVVGSYRVAGFTVDCVLTAPAAAPGRAAADCPAGTTPQRRVTLAELTRFQTLHAFLGKDPGGGGAPPVPPP